MIPLKEQWVKVFFRNSMQAEGYVEFWSEEQAVLRADEGLSLLIIQDVKADIMAVKVYTYPDPPPPKEPKIAEKTPLDEEFEKVRREDKIDEYLKAKTLIELRKLQAEQDRKIISEKLREHTPTSQVKVPKYELPGLFKK
jgi:hypothetical protein